MKSESNQKSWPHYW